MGNSPIVNRINSLLAERGIDKKKFYEDCGITSASYSLWNTGKTKPRMKNLETIADYLRVPVSYLLEGKEQKEKPALHMENGFDADTKELFDIWNSEDEAGRKALIEMARFLKSKREK